ncbi:scabin-related ADP-ribosyltransferase [Streptomyces gobitricini]|uniref:scabin-related ADP-ribosyltransferase n=1 Tax=Streptomyces gobitricini TaxID=68211 RepID=UPI0031D3A24D
MPVVWREGHEPLYRSDNRPPDYVFENGFEPRGPSNTDLTRYVAEDEPSAFVSTSYREDIGDEFGGKFTYAVGAPGGIDVNRTLGGHSLSYEEEVAFPGGIRAEYIKGAYSYDYGTGELGEFIPNPNYLPEAERVK